MNPSSDSLYLKCLSHEMEVRINAKETLKYKHGSPDYERFCQLYEKEKFQNWMGRKILVIPNFCVGIVKAIIHCVQVIFSLVFYLVTQEENWKISFIVCSYRIRRDLEEMKGHLLSLVCDRLGRFLIEQAQYHQRCYDAFSPCSASKSKYGEIIQDRLKETSLLKYKQFSANQQKAYQTAYYGNSLGRTLWILDSKEINFEKFLNENSDEILEQYTLEDLVFYDKSGLLQLMLGDGLSDGLVSLN